MRRISQEELEARAVIYGKPIEIDIEQNIAVLVAAGKTWYASLVPVEVATLVPAGVGGGQ